MHWETLGGGAAPAWSRFQDTPPCCPQSMYIATWTAEKGWDAGSLQPYGPIPMLPSAQVLNYGQAIFEGMKAQESAKGRIVLFRPDKNAERFAAGAERLSMPPVPEAQFVGAVQSLVSANKDWVSPRPGPGWYRGPARCLSMGRRLWFQMLSLMLPRPSPCKVPPIGKGSLYIRPLLVGSGPILGLGPAPAYTFAIFAAAVGAYFKVCGGLPPQPCLLRTVVQELIDSIVAGDLSLLGFSEGIMNQPWSFLHHRCSSSNRGGSSPRLTSSSRSGSTGQPRAAWAAPRQLATTPQCVHLNTLISSLTRSH